MHILRFTGAYFRLANYIHPRSDYSLGVSLDHGQHVPIRHQLERGHSASVHHAARHTQRVLRLSHLLVLVHFGAQAAQDPSLWPTHAPQHIHA